MEHSGHAPLALLGEVGSGEEGLLVRTQEEGGGPAAAASEGLADGHVEAVNVRPFLPVYLDGYKTLVQQVGDLLVLEALVGHYVAPVAGAVADAEKDGFILSLGLFKGLLAPGIPVHGIVRVLAQVRAGLALQMVRHSVTSLLGYFP